MEYVKSLVSNSHVKNTLCLLGGYFLIKQSINFFQWTYKHFISSLFNNDLASKYGKDWVIITGGSSGIGLSFAKQFTKLGFKVLIISSNETKLTNVKTELLNLYENSTVDYIQYDFNRKYTEDEVTNLSKLIKEKTEGNISILINNVGALKRDHLLNLTNEEINKMININVTSVTFLTKIVLNFMIERQGKSLIVTSGSIAGRMRTETRSIYSSTKFYLEAFTETIKKEYKDKIDVTYLQIGPVDTELNPLDLPLTAKPDDFAKQSMKKLGKYEFTTGHIKHEMMMMLWWNLPFGRENLMKSRRKPEPPKEEPPKEEPPKEEPPKEEPPKEEPPKEEPPKEEPPKEEPPKEEPPKEEPPKEEPPKEEPPTEEPSK